MAKPGKKKLAVIGAAIIAALFAVEGPYVNNPKDPGGATNHGITERVARQHGYTGHMRDLTKDTASDIYYTDYIKKPGYEPILERSPIVAHELVDSAANAGPSRASRWFQVALNALNRDQQDYPDVVVDGKVGPATIRAYDRLIAKRGRVKSCSLMVKLLDAQQAGHYLSLTNLETFMVGWVDNRLWNVPVDRCGGEA